MNKEEARRERRARALQKRTLSQSRAQQCGQLQCDGLQLALWGDSCGSHCVVATQGVESREPSLFTSSCLQRVVQMSLPPLALAQRLREELAKQKKEEQNRTPLL